MVEQYYIPGIFRARKLNVSVIFLSQSFFYITKMIRTNCSRGSFNKTVYSRTNREVNMELSEFGLGVSKEELLALYEYATKEKFSPMIIDMEDRVSVFERASPISWTCIMTSSVSCIRQSTSHRHPSRMRFRARRRRREADGWTLLELRSDGAAGLVLLAYHLTSH
jgi:hypothetical protein